MDILYKIPSVVLAIAGIHLAVMEFFNYNIIGGIVPQYAKYVYGAMGLVGVYILYTTFKR